MEVGVEMKRHIDAICKRMIQDREYFYAWQANLAVCFQDECARNKIGPRKKIHGVSNAAAFNFLKMLILVSNPGKKKVRKRALR